jgi:hypothetical protein
MTHGQQQNIKTIGLFLDKAADKTPKINSLKNG